MRDPDPPLEWREGFAHSRLIVLGWNPAPHYDAAQRARLAYAMALGKPIRLFVRAGDRLPPDLCAGYADLQVAPWTGADAMQRQILAWLAALED